MSQHSLAPLTALGYGSGRSSWPSCVAYSPDGLLLAVGGSENSVQVVATSTWKTLATYRGHSEEVSALAWASDGARLASASLDGTVHLWGAASGERLATYRGHSGPSTPWPGHPTGASSPLVART
jgi:WD40 repeat protein